MYVSLDDLSDVSVVFTFLEFSNKISTFFLVHESKSLKFFASFLIKDISNTPENFIVG